MGIQVRIEVFERRAGFGTDKQLWTVSTIMLSTTEKLKNKALKQFCSFAMWSL